MATKKGIHKLIAMDRENIQQKFDLKGKLSLDLGIVKPIITKVHCNFPIKYINIPTSHLITQYTLSISQSNNLYRPLK